MSDNTNKEIQALRDELNSLKSQRAVYQVPQTPVTQVNAEGPAVKVVGVASGGEQIGAAMIGLFTAGPLGALASWGAIRMFAGKWTPWLITGVVAAPVLGLAQIVALGGAAVMIPTTTDNTEEVRLVEPPEEVVQEGVNTLQMAISNSDNYNTSTRSLRPGQATYQKKGGDYTSM